jgi:hypothetical protein
MLKIRIGDANGYIPQSWSEITLGDYEQWSLYQTDSGNGYLQLMAAICKIDIAVLKNISVDEFEVIRDTLRFVSETEVEPSPQIEIGGQQFSVSPSDKLTLGEWVDIDTIMASDSHTKISEMLAVVCRPAGEDYDPEKSQSRYDLFRSLTCDKALAPVNFFLLRKKKSDEILNLYSEVVEQAARFVRDTDRFVTNGDGIKLLPIWQRIRYTFLIRSLKKRLSKFSDSSSTASTSRVPKTTSTASKDR